MERGNAQGCWRYCAKERLMWVAGEAELAKAKVVADDVATEVNIMVGKILFLDDMESAAQLRLSIPYFTEEQLGCAAMHGPMSLDVVVAVCKEIKEAFDNSQSSESVCVACSDRPGATANSWLLVGAFLILERGWLARDVTQHWRTSERGAKIEERFPTPWEQRLRYTRDSLTTVDCLSGLEEAVHRGWLDYHGFNVHKRHSVALAYDAMHVFTLQLTAAADQACSGAPQQKPFIVQFWIAADPVTTVMDPHSRHEATAVDSEPSSSDLKNDISKSELGVAKSKCIESTTSVTTVGTLQTKASKTSRSITAMTKTLSKMWKPRQRSLAEKGSAPQSAMKRPENLSAFAKWLEQDLHSTLLVRANFMDERNLPGGSYAPACFVNRELLHLDVPFEDGTSPPNQVLASLCAEVRRALDRCAESALEGTSHRSIMIHCKSGLGRSMSLLAALAVEFSSGLNSEAFFGWARLVRPGCIQTAAQERFVRSLSEDGARCCCLRQRRTREQSLLWI